MTCSRRHRPYVLLWLLVLAHGATSAQETGLPTYLAYRADPIQKEYSAALLGFAVEKKCSFLSESSRTDYERRLDQATEIFQGYVLAKGMAQSPREALQYPKDMALGAIRFAAPSACDASAKERVNKGFDVARDFHTVLGRPFK